MRTSGSKTADIRLPFIAFTPIHMKYMVYLLFILPEGRRFRMPAIRDIPALFDYV
jgi:hypothetical protein